jgi:hypothetical protein
MLVGLKEPEAKGKVLYGLSLMGKRRRCRSRKLCCVTATGSRMDRSRGHYYVIYKGNHNDVQSSHMS